MDEPGQEKGGSILRHLSVRCILDLSSLSSTVAVAASTSSEEATHGEVGGIQKRDVSQSGIIK